jgi:Mannosyltransferase (PIG-V)
VSVTETPLAAVAAPGARRRPAEVLRPLALPLAAYLASRVLTFLAIALSAFTQHRSLHRIMTVWDGRWYEKIVYHGYPRWVAHGDFYRGTGRTVQSAVAFFPLYPAIVRVADVVVPGSAWVAGVVVALLLGAVATALVWIIADQVAGRRVADRAAVLFAFSPGAFVLSLVYAEALMVVLAGGCLLALMHRRWLLAGVLAALATATRPNAMALVVACAWAAGVAFWQDRDRRALIAPLVAPVGMVAFMLFLWHHTGEPLIWFRVEATGWGERVDFGWSNAGTFIRMISDPNQMVLAISLVFALVLIYLLVRARLPGVLNAYAGTALFLVLTSHINARPRFLFVAFPLAIALAKYVKRSTAFTVLAATFAASTVMLTIFYGLQTKNYYP